MILPTINTRATNVELTDERRSLITRKLAPLARFLVHEGEVSIDVVMRRIRTRLGGTMYYLSVKVTTPSGAYLAVASETHLAKALTKVRETLRKSISRGSSAIEYGVRKARRMDESAYTLTV